LLIDLLAILGWNYKGPHPFSDFLCLNILGLALASVSWTLVKRFQSLREGESNSDAAKILVDYTRLFRHGALLVSAGLVAFIVVCGFLWVSTGGQALLTNSLSWSALATVIAAAFLCLWDDHSGFPLPTLYGAGLIGILLELQGANAEPSAIV